MLKQLLMAALFALLLHAGDSRAASSPVFVKALNAADMVHDFRRNRIYVAGGNQVVRYSLATNQFLPAIPLDESAQARGIDMSGDGTLLAVADLSYSATQAWIYLIDLNTGVATKHAFARESSGDSGTWSVAFDADNNLLVTTDYPGSGWGPLRRLTLSTGQWTKVISMISQRTMLAASADRQTIAFAESNISDGRWGLYDVPSGQYVERTGYTDGTSEFNYEIATDALGGTFAIPTYQGMYVYDVEFQKKWTIPAVNGQAPVGVAFHPVQPLLYYPLTGTSQMRVFNTATGKPVAWYDMGVTFTWTGNHAYGPGRTKLSADGSLLMMTSSGGIRYIRFYAPLTARNIVVSATTATSKSIALPGSIGNHGTLTFERWSLPKHGTVTVSGSTATYKSVAGYRGTDSFRYLVRYGVAAYAVGTVTVRVQ